ncbi:hypothetical protein FOZ63_008134, partial [Perkinsus olseni]
VPQADVVDRLGILTLFEHDHDATAREYARGYENSQLSVQLVDIVESGNSSEQFRTWERMWGVQRVSTVLRKTLEVMRRTPPMNRSLEPFQCLAIRKAMKWQSS